MITEQIRRGRGRFDFTVVSRTCHPEVRRLARWRRVPGPERPFRLRWAAFFLAAPAQLRRAHPDLIHTWGPAPMIPSRVDLASVALLQAGYHAAAGSRPPGASIGWRAARAFKLGLERWSYGGRTRLLDVSTPQAKEALERHVPGAKVAVTPRVVDGERFRPDPADRDRVRSELSAESDLVALFVGRDWDLKGLDLAIQGLALAARDEAGSLRLWVAGGTQRRRLEAIATRHGLEGRVDFLGFRPDIERLYRGADLFLLPSLYEHFCRAAHEAASSELPLVATRVGGIADLLDQGAGIPVGRSADSIANALARLAGDPGLRRQMGARGRELCARFRPELWADRYLELYEQLLSATR